MSLKFFGVVGSNRERCPYVTVYVLQVGLQVSFQVEQESIDLESDL